ncbi:hypothetical protein RI054_29g119480 [Pseudoscourfieldia marina]
MFGGSSSRIVTSSRSSRFFSSSWSSSRSSRLFSSSSSSGSGSGRSRFFSRRRAGLLASGFVVVASSISLGSVRAMGASTSGSDSPLVRGEESIMAQKTHGTTEAPVQADLRWNVDRSTADRIVSFNRHWAERAGYWETTEFVKYLKSYDFEKEGPITFYDSVTGKPLFRAPVGRTMDEFIRESQSHGWPSFRDQETVWEDVRVLGDGETVSLAGSHLGHNLPDRAGNRYCINLVSIAGKSA